MNRLLTAFALSSALLLGGCATGSNPKDPFEPVNRKVYAFNDAVDSYALKPIAQGYVAVTPQPVRTGVSNFFGNLDDALIGVNNLLQGKALAALSDVGRLAVNSTVGILGIFDVATDMGLEKHEEDFGQTLAVWGVGDGPFLMLPFFGPSTLRDTSNVAVNLLVPSPISAIDDIPTRNVVRGVKLVDARAQLLDAGKLLEDAALDKYSYLRDFYLKRRRSLIFDGNPPREKLDDDAALAPFDTGKISAKDVFLVPVARAETQNQ